MKETKNILERILDFFIYSNLLISIAAFVFTLQTALNFHYSASASAFFAFTNFVSTFILYNLQRLYQSTKPFADHRLQWYQHNRRILFTMIFVLLSLYFLVFKVNYQVFSNGLLLYIPAAIISIFYFLPPFALRKMPVFKIFIIALVWVFSNAFIPLLYNELHFSLSHLNRAEWMYLASQFCFIAAICIPFDIRDIKADSKNSVRTIPAVYGINRAKTIGILLLLAYMSLATNTQQLMICFATGVLGIVLIYFSSEHKHRYYYSVFVDGLIILQFILSMFLFSGN